MHTGYEKEVANLKQEAQQLLKTSVRIDNLFPHERDCRNGKTIARPSGRAGSSSQQTQQTPRGSNSNERNLTRKSEPTSNERRKGRKWRFHHKAGRNEKAVPLSFFIQTNGPKLKHCSESILIFRIFLPKFAFATARKKKTAIAFSGYVFYICIDILEPRKV